LRKADSLFNCGPNDIDWCKMFHDKTILKNNFSWHIYTFTMKCAICNLLKFSKFNNSKDSQAILMKFNRYLGTHIVNCPAKFEVYQSEFSEITNTWNFRNFADENLLKKSSTLFPASCRMKSMVANKP